jgi:prepilin peptidase CpaA
MTQTVLWTCLFVVLVAALFDLFTGLIPNRVSIGGYVVALAVHAAIGVVDEGAFGGLRAAGIAAGSGLLCALVPLICWWRGEMGGGDVKLFAAIGAFVGPAIGIHVVGLTFVLSCLVLAPYRLIRSGAVRHALTNGLIRLKNVFREKTSWLPYLDGPKLPRVVLAPTIAVALVLTLGMQGAFS